MQLVWSQGAESMWEMRLLSPPVDWKAGQQFSAGIKGVRKACSIPKNVEKSLQTHKYRFYLAHTKAFGQISPAKKSCADSTYLTRAPHACRQTTRY